MCGIFGCILQNSKQENIIELIIIALNLLKNRGYDSCGIFIESSDTYYLYKLGIDGNIIKGWCSGGDEHTTRQLYKTSPTQFKMQPMLAFFANDFPEIEPADALETCHAYHSIRTYVSQSRYDIEQAKNQPQVLKDKYVVGNELVKEQCEHSMDWANAFI